MSNIPVVIPDAHARPGVPNDRFTWLGEYLLDLRLSNPEASIKVIDLGDWEDMPSLSSYDIGKKSYEGRRYLADVAAGIDARKRVNQPIDEYNEYQRKIKKKTMPLVVITQKDVSRKLSKDLPCLMALSRPTIFVIKNLVGNTHIS